MAKYTVAPEREQPVAAAPDGFAVPAPSRTVAVFIAHGMGQQIPFESLDQIAEGLRQRDVAGGHYNQKPVARALKAGDEWLSRIELQLKSDAQLVEAHVYESYWAPLTEGRVTIRDVIGFLAGAGANGIRNARRGRFDRWLFGTYAEYPIPVRTLFFLLITVAVIAALVIMNASIAVVGAGLSFLGRRPDWLTDGLLGDLTSTFNAVVTAFVATGIALGVGVSMRKLGASRRLRVAWSWLTAPIFGVTMGVVILAGVAIALLFFVHLRGVAGPAQHVWHEVLGASRVVAFDRVFAAVAFTLAIVGLGLYAVWFIGGMIMGVVRDLADPGGRPATAVTVIVFAALVAAISMLVVRVLAVMHAAPAASTAALVGGGVAWVLLVATSGYIRRILVQYIGDVAVYIMPYRLDAFNDLRKQIKERSLRVAQGIYAMRTPDGSPVYDAVIIVGHSLGSVISYDVLNQLIRDDEAARGALNVVGRTPLFMTFGSPLDKTAFIFAQQGAHTSEAREALAATVQPMLRDYALRPARWVNIYSGWDIISGHVGFYDLEENRNRPHAVSNLKDPDATTLLVAHTEYWNNDLVFQVLYDAL